MEVPNVKRKDYQLIGVEDDFLSLMDDTGDTRDDLKCPEDSIGDEIREAIAAERDILVGFKMPSDIIVNLVLGQRFRFDTCVPWLQLSILYWIFII